MKKNKLSKKIERRKEVENEIADLMKVQKSQPHIYIYIKAKIKWGISSCNKLPNMI